MKQDKQVVSKEKKQMPLWKFILLVNVSIFMIIVSVVYPQWKKRRETLNGIRDDLIQLSLQNVQMELSEKLSVAVGYNSNVDLIVKAVPVMNRLLLRTVGDDWLMMNSEDVKCNLLHSSEQFASCFAKYFARGDGVERFAVNRTFFTELIDLSEQDPSHHFHIGGNAALMAVKFAIEDWNVALTGGSIGNNLRNLLSDYEITYITKSDTEEDRDDEIHLIMEYDKAERWANCSSPRANRFIVTRDITNAEFHSLDNFHRHLNQNIKNIDLVVLSGFHLLDGETDEFKRKELFQRISEKIRETTSIADSIRKNFVIHLELASIGQEIIYNEIAEYVFPFVHSIGLNEQELDSLHHATQESKLPAIAQVIPNLESVVQALVAILQSYSRISRIHFHNLAYHLLVIREVKDEEAYLSAVSSSSLQAATQACGFTSREQITSSKVDLLFKWQEQISTFDSELFKQVSTHGSNSGSVHSWTVSGFRFYLAPVLVCKQTIKTVGLGDAISTIGLSAELKVTAAKTTR